MYRERWLPSLAKMLNSDVAGSQLSSLSLAGSHIIIPASSNPVEVVHYLLIVNSRIGQHVTAYRVMFGQMLKRIYILLLYKAGLW